MRSEVRAGRRKRVHVGWLRRRRTGVHGEQGPIKAGGARSRAERTLNMLPMSVTVEVSKMLSDWSNDAVLCRVERRAYDAGRAGREAAGCVWRDTAAQAACTGKARLKACGASAHARGAPGTFVACS
jgi:hypothetical protein